MAQAQQQQGQRQQNQQQGKQVTTAEYLNGIQEALMKQIAEKMGAMPEGFNKDRFVLNCITLIRDMLKDNKKRERNFSGLYRSLHDKRSFPGAGFFEWGMLRNPVWR